MRPANSMMKYGSLFVMTWLLCGSSPAQEKPVQAQRSTNVQQTLQQEHVDYVQREKTAPPAIKTKLNSLRAELKAKGRSFTVGYTSAMDMNLEQLAGTRIPKDTPRSVIQTVNARGEELRAIDLQSAEIAHIKVPTLACSPTGSSYDWRLLNKVTPVKAQICGTCWDFAAMGAYESSYALRNNRLVDTSEQYILNCSHAGNCSGGWWMPVFDFMISTGTAAEAADPFTGNDGAACPSGTRTPFRAVSWAFVGPDISTIPTPAQIKQALCTHGPLATAVMADSGFQAYTGGVFDEHDQHFDWINHGITIIGWDDSKGAWLIKNSWGTTWGETGGYGSSNGYMWIKYNTNNVGIATAWVSASSNLYIINPIWFKTLEKYKIQAKPLPDLRERELLR